MEGEGGGDLSYLVVCPAPTLDPSQIGEGGLQFLPITRRGLGSIEIGELIGGRVVFGPVDMRNKQRRGTKFQYPPPSSPSSSFSFSSSSGITASNGQAVEEGGAEADRQLDVWDILPISESQRRHEPPIPLHVLYTELLLFLS